MLELRATVRRSSCFLKPSRASSLCQGSSTQDIHGSKLAAPSYCGGGRTKESIDPPTLHSTTAGVSIHEKTENKNSLSNATPHATLPNMTQTFLCILFIKNKQKWDEQHTSIRYTFHPRPPQSIAISMASVPHISSGSGFRAALSPVSLRPQSRSSSVLRPRCRNQSNILFSWPSMPTTIRLIRQSSAKCKVEVAA